MWLNLSISAEDMKLIVELPNHPDCLSPKHLLSAFGDMFGLDHLTYANEPFDVKSVTCRGESLKTENVWRWQCGHYSPEFGLHLLSTLQLLEKPQHSE
jgi:hypothetical protein